MKRRVRHHLKTILDLLLNKSNSFECQVSMLFFFLNHKKLSSHMAQISEHINFSNKNIPSYDKIIRIIDDLGSKTV